jgi:hypothetical protein
MATKRKKTSKPVFSVSRMEDERRQWELLLSDVETLATGRRIRHRSSTLPRAS